MDWRQGSSDSAGSSVDVEALRVRLSGMSDMALMDFGKQMHGLVYPLRYGADGKPSVSAFSIQLEVAREEWRRRQAKGA